MSFPFARVKPLGWALFEVLTSAQMTQIDLQQSEGAPGSIYSDVAQLANLTPSLTNPTDLGRSLIYLPETATSAEAIVSFGWAAGGLVPAAHLISAPGLTSTSLTIPLDEGLGTFNAECSVWDGGTAYLIGGQPNTTSKKRLRRSTNGGTTWTSEETNHATGTQGVQCMGYSPFHSKFLLALNGTIETSTSGATGTWATAAGLPNADTRTTFTTNPATGRVLVQSASASGARLLKSDDLTTWTQEATPQSFERIIWSPFWGKYFGFHSSGCYSSTTGLASSWSSVSAVNFGGSSTAVRSFVSGRILGHYGTSGLFMSVDGGVSWTIAGGPSASPAALVMGVRRLALSRNGNHAFGWRAG